MTPGTAWVQVGKGCYGRNRLTPIITYRPPFFLLSGEIVCIHFHFHLPRTTSVSEHLFSHFQLISAHILIGPWFLLRVQSLSISQQSSFFLSHFHICTMSPGTHVFSYGYPYVCFWPALPSGNFLNALCLVIMWIRNIVSEQITSFPFYGWRSVYGHFKIGSKTLKSSILVFLALLSLSPVLRTLSASTSSDSIWALAACLFILNIVLADFDPARDGRLGRERWFHFLVTHLW